jgi:hypothetical protein
MGSQRISEWIDMLFGQPDLNSADVTVEDELVHLPHVGSYVCDVRYPFGQEAVPGF